MLLLLSLGLAFCLLSQRGAAFLSGQDNVASSKRRILSSRSSLNNDNHSLLGNNNNDNDDSSWTLEKDWALQDRVSKYTVSGATFWTQLWLSTPELCSFESEEQLKERYEYLCSTKHLPMRAGEAPFVLEQWTVDQDNNKVTGRLQDRTVWFTAQLFGSWDDEHSGNFEPKAGGYVEALGGRVYELGQPKYALETNDQLPFLLPEFKLPAVTGTLSALLASTVLSAAIGYAAGISLLEDSHQATQPAQMSAAGTVAMREYKQKASVSEQRAKTEARVLGESRMISQISQRLEQDRADVAALKAKEQSQGAESTISVVVSDSNPVKIKPSTTELRARKEARLLNEERAIVNLKRELEKDQVKLEELLKQEKDM